MPITLDEQQVRLLQRVILYPKSLRQLSKARTIRLAIKGEPIPRIARRLRISPAKVEARIKKFERKGILDWLKPNETQLKPRRQLEEEYYDKVQFHKDLDELLEKNDDLLRRLAQ